MDSCNCGAKTFTGFICLLSSPKTSRGVDFLTLGSGVRIGAAMPNGPKNKSPPISMKFGDILESTLTKM